MRLRLKPEKLFPLSAFHTFPLRQHAGGEPEPRFLEKSGADARLRARFEAWRAMLWRLLEYRYWLYRISRERKTDLETGRST